jgi:hypothetical protein
MTVDVDRQLERFPPQIETILEFLNVLQAVTACCPVDLVAQFAGRTRENILHIDLEHFSNIAHFDLKRLWLLRYTSQPFGKGCADRVAFNARNKFRYVYVAAL